MTADKPVRPTTPADWRDRLTPWLGLLLCLALTGCSSFGREWRAAAQTPPPADDITGRWTGKWISAANGHSGRLRCIITRDSAQTLQARYHARYAGILSFGYRVSMAVTNVGGQFEFRGSADLGRLAGGVYHYEGRASATNFFSVYRSAGDHGRFEMQRPSD